jgi:Methyltransferase domain
VPTITDQLRAAPPGIHGAGDEYWGLAWPALEWLERELRPGMATLETGSGASTIVFAAAGTDHVAVTPDPAEEERVRAACAELGVSSDAVSFRVGYSHDVLPHLADDPLDLVLLDGAHGFPYPTLDWWYLARRLVVGGRILLDDAYMPPVTVVADHARTSPAWEIEGSIGYRTAVIRKRSDVLPPFDWDGQRIGGHMTFRYLPPLDRVAASTRHRVFSTRAGLALVRAYRRGSGLKWRKTG